MRRTATRVSTVVNAQLAAALSWIAMANQRVLKFGGAALRDGEAVRRVAGIVRTRGGTRPIMVVSAHEGVTDLLERTARRAAAGELAWDDVRIRHRTLLRQLRLPEELLDRQLRELQAILRELAASRRMDTRARDFVLSFGERMSARIVAAVLRREGLVATPLDAFDLGLVHEPGPAAPLAVGPPPARVRDALARVPGVPVVTGFLAQDAAGNVVTLGRNGSDLSAAWIAEAVGADEIQLWKTVAGVQTADPALVPDARTVPHLGWEEATELSAQGAVVLHPGTTEPARRAGIPIRLLSVADPEAPGTRIHGVGGTADVLALTHRACTTLLSGPLEAGRRREEELAALFAALHTAGAAPWIGAVSAREVDFVLTGTVPARELISLLPHGGRVERHFASLGIVARDELRAEEACARVRESLARAGIHPRAAPGGGGAHGAVLLVRSAQLGAALRAAHAALFEAARPAPPATIREGWSAGRDDPRAIPPQSLR